MAAEMAPGSHKVKRRDLRKGTHSCWECKRRKMKCIFDPLASTNICRGCHRRGSPCVSQAFPETLAKDLSNAEHRNAVRVRHASTHGEHHDSINEVVSTSGDVLSLSFSEAQPRRSAEFPPNRPSVSTPKHEALSRSLYKLLPSPQDEEKIFGVIPHPPLFAYELMTMPYTTLDTPNDHGLDATVERPREGDHPVLITKHMLLLASSLQHFHCRNKDSIHDISEDPRRLSETLVNAVHNLVTTKDELLGSIEAVECITLESMLQANLGNLRQCWLISRRAMSIAQLMGLDRSNNRAQYELLDRRKVHNHQHMWSQIVFLDRFLSLILGLPQGCNDQNMSSTALLATELPMKRFERIHCVIASRILERSAHPGPDDYALTRALDLELQNVANSLPNRFWSIPNLGISDASPQSIVFNTGRIFAQVLHYNLMNKLHLPYMLRSAGGESSSDFSLVTCVNASREVLIRFLALRAFNNLTSSCRITDFLALMAALTLLLAHLDGQLSGADNILGHQYQSDRAMIEQVHGGMNEASLMYSDPMSERSASILQRLLAIDFSTPGDTPLDGRRVDIQQATSDSAPPDRDDEAVMSVYIPYFGIIRVVYGADLQQSRAHPSVSTSPTNQDGHSRPVNNSATRPNKEFNTAQHDREAVIPGSGTQVQSLQSPASTPHNDFMDMNDAEMRGDQPAAGDSQFGEFPGLAAGLEDWTFQGMDMVAFDDFLRSV